MCRLITSNDKKRPTTIIIIIVIITHHPFGLDRPVSAWSNSHFKGLSIQLCPFGLKFIIILDILLLKRPIKVKITHGDPFTAPNEMQLSGSCSITLHGAS
jgi:hypothetical protein